MNLCRHGKRLALLGGVECPEAEEGLQIRNEGQQETIFSRIVGRGPDAPKRSRME